MVEVSHLLGDAWYRDRNYDEASPYLELAWEGKKAPNGLPRLRTKLASPVTSWGHGVMP